MDEFPDCFAEPEKTDGPPDQKDHYDQPNDISHGVFFLPIKGNAVSGAIFLGLISRVFRHHFVPVLNAIWHVVGDGKFNELCRSVNIRLNLC